MPPLVRIQCIYCIGCSCALASTGCATMLSGAQPAHVPAKGHMQAVLGVDLSMSAGSINKVVRAAEAVDEASSTRPLTDDEKLTLFEGGAHLGFNPPEVIPHVGVAYAPFERWEIGGRFSASGWRAAVRRQLLDQAEQGVDLSIGLGFGTAIFTPPIQDVLTKLRLDSSSRINVDIPVTIGRKSSWYRWWTGPRLAYSHVSQSMTLSLPNDAQITGSVDGNGFYFGGQAGVVLGYRSFFVGPELTLVELIGGADVSAQRAGQAAQRRTVDVDAFIIYPSFNIMGEL